MLEQEKKFKTVEDIKQKDANKGASGTNRPISGILQEVETHLLSPRGQKQRQLCQSILIQNKNILKIKMN